jgi:general secretion pathway protein J
MRSKRRRTRGFTLLEVMIALTLSVMLLGLLTAGMRFIVDEWQDSNNPFETELDQSLILLQIEQALLGAFPHGYVDQETLEQNVFFLGDSESLTWVSTVSPQAKQELTAWHIHDDGRSGVMLRTTPAFADSPLERIDQATGTPLFADSRMVLSYLTLDDAGRPEWLEEWNGAEHQELPMAVRLTLTDEGRSTVRDVELVVPILVRQHESIQPVDVQ